MTQNNSTKRVKGSAIVSEGGEFIFTPYATHPEEEKTLKLVAIEGNATLWKSKNAYSIRIKIPFKTHFTLAKAAELIMKCFAHLKNDRLKDEEQQLKKKKKASKTSKKELSKGENAN